MIYYGNNDYRDYLAHHGVLGMRWGIRRYQPYSIGYQREGGEKGRFIGGKLSSAASGIKNKLSNIPKSLRAKSARKKKLASLQKAREAKAQKAEERAKQAEEKKIQEQKDREAKEARQHLLATGSAEDILKNRETHKFTNKELDEAINRLNKEKTLKELQTAETIRKMEVAKKVVNELVDYGKVGISIYDLYSNVKQRQMDYKDLQNKELVRKVTRSEDLSLFNKNASKLTNKEITDYKKRIDDLHDIRAMLDPSISGNKNKNNQKNGNNQNQQNNQKNGNNQNQQNNQNTENKEKTGFFGKKEKPKDEVRQSPEERKKNRWKRDEYKAPGSDSDSDSGSNSNSEAASDSGSDTEEQTSKKKNKKSKNTKSEDS